MDSKHKDTVFCRVIITAKTAESLTKFEDLVSYLFEGICKMKGFEVSDESPSYSSENEFQLMCRGARSDFEAFRVEIFSVFDDIKAQFGDIEYTVLNN